MPILTLFSQISKKNSQLEVENAMPDGLHNPGAWCHGLYSTFRDGTGRDLSVSSSIPFPVEKKLREIANIIQRK